METCPYTPGKYNILTSLNHGFRSGYSCETQLIVTLSDLLQSYDQNKHTDVVILDFSKAFDTVPHDKLMYKLEKYGIKGDFHK
jgi:retron-type reverse transcriptase